MIRFFAIAAISGCTTEQVIYRIPEGASGDTAAPLDCAAAGTWATVGQPLALTWCTGCHSSHLDGGDRHGAPDSVNLDSLAGWQAHGARSRARAIDGTMPPGGGLSAADLAALRVWVGCGAPGDEHIVSTEAPTWGPTAGATVWTRVADGADGAVTLEHDIAERFGDATYGRVLREDLVMDGGEAWLAGFVWSDSDGRRLRSEAYDPPLPLQGGAEGWSADTTATIETADGSFTEDQTWTFTRGSAPDLDPRSPDPLADQLLAVEDGGSEHGWHISNAHGLTGRWAFTDGEAGFAIQQLLDQEAGGWPGLPVRPGDDWRGSMVVYGGFE